MDTGVTFEKLEYEYQIPSEGIIHMMWNDPFVLHEKREEKSRLLSEIFF